MLRSRHMGQSWMVIVCESGSTTIKMRKRERISSFSGFCLSEYSTLNLYSHLSILLKFRLKTLPTNGEQHSWNTKCNLWVQSHFSHVRLFATPWIVAHQAPLSMGFSRQEFWSGLPCPPPGDLLDTGIEPACLIVSSIGRLVLHH